jgi:hypothetical protein
MRMLTYRPRERMGKQEREHARLCRSIVICVLQPADAQRDEETAEHTTSRIVRKSHPQPDEEAAADGLRRTTTTTR